MSNFNKPKNGFIRITKRKARNLFNQGKTICFCPVNFRVDTAWYYPNTANNQFESDFDDFVKGFEYYNCTGSQTGKYAAFYLDANKNKEEAK